MEPIQAETSLPDEGVDRESRRFDFKKTVSSKNHVELAKDVAAFANAFGGHILVGAVEDPQTGRLDHYEPLPEAFAHEVVTAFDRAVATRCFPKPLHDSKLLPRGEGFVVVVNVWAFPGGIVGVRSDTQDAYLFPVRVGAQTDHLRPEVLPMFMVPEVRRIAVLLGSIPARNRSCICASFRMRSSQGTEIARTNLDLVELREQENVAVFRVSEFQRKDYITNYPTNCRVHIPLDQVESAWSESTGDWALLLRGRFHVRDNQITYVPLA